MKFAATKEMTKEAMDGVTFLTPADISSQEAIVIDDRGLHLRDWLKATLEKHVAEDTPPFHGEFEQIYHFKGSDPEDTYGEGVIEVHVSSGGHAFARGVLDYDGEWPIIVYGFDGSRGFQSQMGDLYGHSLEELFGSPEDWYYYESSGPMANELTPGTGDADEIPGRAMRPWETRGTYTVRTRHMSSLYNQTVREALLSATFTHQGLEEIYRAFLGSDYHGGVAAHQYQEIVLEHFFNGQSYEVKRDRIDAARRFLLQCLIAKDLLEEVFL